MKIDFTANTYTELISAFKVQGFSFQSVEQFITAPSEKVVILRHDIDRLPYNALRIAEIENGFGISASYYFRMIEEVYNEVAIKRVAELGHEIGYHYETMDTSQGDVERAYNEFCRNLDKLRRVVSIRTACMHGSPLSRYDNRDIWKKYTYKELGIIAEPYFDMNFRRVFYVTDTGRKWNNTESSLRDKVDSGFNITIKNTFHFIELIKQNCFPEILMINTHPQRWNNSPVTWARELVLQNLKNIPKRYLVKIRHIRNNKGYD